MSATRCYYHNNKIAVATCERCHRPICLEDKQVYHKTHYYGDNQYSTTHEYCTMCFASQHEIDTTYSVIGAIIFIIILVLGLGSFSVISTNIVHINSNNNFNNNNFNNNYFPSSMVLSGVTYYCNNQGICDPSTSSSFTQSTQSFPVMILFVLFVFIFIFIGAFIYIRSQSNKNIDNAFKLKKNVDSMNKPESSGHTSNLMQSFVPLYQKKKEISKIQYYECGTELSLEDKFCPNCGEDTKDELKTFSENNFT